jgi:cytochrome c553
MIQAGRRMKFSTTLHIFSLAALSIGGIASGESMRPEPTAQDIEFFESRVRPVLSQYCYECHGAEAQKGGLRLDHIQHVLKGGDSGPAVKAGDPATSKLFEAIAYQNVDLQMPPRGILPEEARQTLSDWITRGAPWPEEPLPEGGAAQEVFDLIALRDSHWAWQPVVDSAPPEVKDSRFQAHPVDRFLQAKREEKGLATAPPADPRVLARRASFALTGLPPTPDEVEAFASDNTPDAFGRLVDGLLARPAYGERWARHWFDLVRYAETHGHEGDYPIRHSWPYRDYVIRALNADLPYDQFVREHIAGDLLPTPRNHPEEGYNESVLATGFWYMHQATHAPVDVTRDQADRIDNQLDVMSKTFLGMTVSCSRCHDHKFDAIPAKDYYAMAGHLYSARQSLAFLDPGERIRAAIQEHDTLRDVQTERTRNLVATSEQLDAARIAEYLQAAARVRFDHPIESDGVPLELPADAKNPEPRKAVGRPVAKVAEEAGLDAALLDRWVVALSEPEVDRPNHPLYAWHTLARSARTLGDAELLNLAATLQDSAFIVPSDPSAREYANFNGPDFGDWFNSGDAFGAGPSGNDSWQTVNGEIVPAPAGAAHSGLVAGKLQGILRSPNFTIDSDFIHFRVTGVNARLRLVIDGYQLRTDNGLLFDDTMIDLGDMRGAMGWRTMGKQVGKYRGHTAYIELIDESDGFIAVDRIVFSDRPEPQAEDPLPMGDLVPAGSLFKSALLDELAARYASAFERAWTATTLDARRTDPFAALLLRRGLWWADTGIGEREAIRATLLESEARIPDPMKAVAMTNGTADDAEYFIRGDHKNPSDTVPRGFLAALDGRIDTTAPDRLALAERMVDPRNPLTARVYVNRIWHHLFGRGIVASVDNFGKLGQLPTHPELLDFLAARFIENGWSTKWLIKYLMETETWRMSSVLHFPESEKLDPANFLLHRMPVRRLEGEAIRDALLALGGNLDPRMYGPSVPAYVAPFEANRRSPQSGPMDGDRRRTIYLEVRRNHLLPMVTAFDAPVPDTTIGARTVSNLPAQALILMNDPFVVAQAEVWCDRLLAANPASLDEVTTRIYQAALSRAPREDERGALTAFVQSQAALYGITESEAWKDRRVLTDLCHTVFMLKEFIYIG